MPNPLVPAAAPGLPDPIDPLVSALNHVERLAAEAAATEGADGLPESPAYAAAYRAFLDAELRAAAIEPTTLAGAVRALKIILHDRFEDEVLNYHDEVRDYRFLKNVIAYLEKQS